MPVERTRESVLFAAVTAAVLRTGADHLARVEPGSRLVDALRSQAVQIERDAGLSPALPPVARRPRPGQWQLAEPESLKVPPAWGVNRQL